MNDNIHLSNVIKSGKIRENLRTPKISVIVPVYNVEQYLSKCIDSILNQNFTDFELLLIDDGSPDRSGAICDEYAARDSRIRVFHKDNGGVSSARNLGLENASGEWITFVDSDDSIKEGALSKVYACISEFCDIIILNSISYSKYKDQYLVKYPIEEAFKNRELDTYTFFLSTGFLRGSICGCIFSRSFLLEHNIFFLENILNAEDSYFFTTVLYYSKRIKILDIDFYLVNEREGSASRDWTTKRLLRFVESISLFRDDINLRKIDFKSSSIHNLFIYNLISSFFNKISISNYKTDYFSLIDKELRVNNFYPILPNACELLSKKILLLNRSIMLYGVVVVLKNIFKYIRS